MVSVVYVSGLSRNLLSTRKAVKQWGKPLVYYKAKAVLGFPGKESLIFNFCSRKELFSVTGVRRTPSQRAALALAAKKAEAIRVEKTNQWGARADMGRRLSQRGALVLAAKTTEVMRTATRQWGPCADVRRSPRQGAALVVTAKARNMMKVHHVLADPSEEITQKMIQAMGIATTGQSGHREARYVCR